MAIERRNPVPPGKYWVDVFEPHIADFRTWLSHNSKTVSVDKQENYFAEGGNPAHNWYLFSVTQDTKWEGPGLPTIADDNIHVSEDTGDKGPPEKTGMEAIEETIEKTGSFLAIAAMVGIAYVGYKILK